MLNTGLGEGDDRAPEPTVGPLDEFEDLKAFIRFRLLLARERAYHAHGYCCKYGLHVPRGGFTGLLSVLSDA